MEMREKYMVTEKAKEEEEERIIKLEMKIFQLEKENEKVGSLTELAQTQKKEIVTAKIKHSGMVNVHAYIYTYGWRRCMWMYYIHIYIYIHAFSA